MKVRLEKEWGILVNEKVERKGPFTFTVALYADVSTRLYTQNHAWWMHGAFINIHIALPWGSLILFCLSLFIKEVICPTQKLA